MDKKRMFSSCPALVKATKQFLLGVNLQAEISKEKGAT